MVRLPILGGSFVLALLLSLLVSFDEVVMTLFVGGADVTTVTIRMWSSALQSVGPELAVPSAILVVISAVCVLGGLSVRRAFAAT
jgi:ABC-type spermidine/putrescine transport system permease subunit II